MFKNTIDLHTHSLFSKHALSSVTENIEYACENGLKVLGLSDHQPNRYNSGADKQNFSGLKVLPTTYKNMLILKGIELNVGPFFDTTFVDGQNSFLKVLDYAIASFHTYDYQPESQELNEKFYLQAMERPLVKILGHLDDGNFLIDYRKIIFEAKKHHILIEINNNSLLGTTPRKNSYENTKTMIGICKELACPVILNSDAHVKYGIGKVDEAYNLCHKLGLSDSLILNANLDLFAKYFNMINIDRRGR